jgi:hypothetical protein
MFQAVYQEWSSKGGGVRLSLDQYGLNAAAVLPALDG